MINLHLYCQSWTTIARSSTLVPAGSGKQRRKQRGRTQSRCANADTAHCKPLCCKLMASLRPSFWAACRTCASVPFVVNAKSIVLVLQDPLAIIGIVSILLPFIILGIAIGTGVVDVNAGSSYGKP